MVLAQAFASIMVCLRGKGCTLQHKVVKENVPHPESVLEEEQMQLSLSDYRAPFKLLAQASMKLSNKVKATKPKWD